MQLTPPTSIAWLFLDLNSYFASVEQQCRPELRGKPVAVVPLETDATCAIAASYEAKALGIKTGTPIYEARRLCPELVCIKADHQRYVEFHHRIIAAVEQLIPVSSVESIDEVACRLDVSERDPQRALALAEQIKARIHRDVGTAIDCSIGIASNRFLAKIATEIEKPNGLVMIRPEDVPHALFSLSFDDIPGIGRNMQRRLYRAGVFTVEQLYQLPAGHMRAIWRSVAGERMWYRLRGVELEEYETTRRVVGHSHVLAPENRPPEQAVRVGKRLLLKAASRLRRLEVYASWMQVGIRLEHGGRFSVKRQFHPHCDNPQLTREWQQCWRQLSKHPQVRGARIKKISVSLYGLTQAHCVQEDLFERSAQIQDARSETLSFAMDAINRRFGRNAITTADSLGEANVVTGTKIAFSRIPQQAEFYE